MPTRVLQLLLGTDNITRVVKLNTSSRVVLRLAQHLFPLELNTYSEIVSFIISNVEKHQISQIKQNDQTARSTRIKEQVLKTF